jgi:hypothetical protein
MSQRKCNRSKEFCRMRWHNDCMTTGDCILPVIPAPDEAAEKGFEIWLRSVCFKPPTSEAYDLAKSAWTVSRKQSKRNETQLLSEIAEYQEQIANLKGGTFKHD